MSVDPVSARARLAAKITEQDAARGRPLTDAEKLNNLRHAIERICGDCGGEVEPFAKCPQCGAVNSEPVTV